MFYLPLQKSSSLNWLVHRVRELLLLSICVLIAACAGTATGISTNSVISKSKVAYKAANKSATNPILVKVRFPSLVHSNAQIQFVQAYAVRALGAQASSQALSHSDSVINSVIKTAYFANEFYGALVERLPKHSVIIEPYEVQLTNNAMLTPAFVDKTPLPPSVLTVEFATFHNPDPAMIMGAHAVTFGDLVTPLMVVHSDPSISPQTGGLLAASAPIIEPADFSGRAKHVEPSALSFISYLNYGPARMSGKKIPIHDSRPAKTGSVLRLPLQKLKMDGERLIKAADKPGNHSKSPYRSAVKPSVDIVVEILNNIDTSRALSTQMGRWAEFYDPKNSRAAFLEPPAAKLAKQRKFLNILYAREGRFVSKRSQKIYQKVKMSDYGQGMRKLVGAETKLLAERRGLADQQNLSFATTVGLSIFSGVASYNGDAAVSTLALTGASLAEQVRGEAQSLSHNLAATFRSNYSAVYLGSYAISVKLADTEKAEIIHSLAEMRKKNKRTYRKVFY